MNSSRIRVIRTARDGGERLTELPAVEWRAPSGRPGPAVVLHPVVRYQTIEGFGGAFTEAAAVTLAQLPQAVQAEVIRAYFDPVSGHGYTLCRTHINSCDFALGNYAYDEVEGDVGLKHFSIDRDRRALIPMIKAAQTVASGALKILASPWSPPAWMKTNGEMNHGGQLKPEYRSAWADYYCRYVHEYAGESIPIWGLTVQNEPLAVQTWDSCIYTAGEERDFVRDYLGPALERSGLADVRLLVWDHNRDVLFDRAKTVLDDPVAAKYVWGVGFHWYESPQRFDNVRRVRDAYPEARLIFTEGCQEGGPHLGEWGLGERYAHAIINDLNAGTDGWIDWNLLLDQRGGPNHVGNFCSAPIIADTRRKQLHYQSSYYYLGHFARYIRPGARRILSSPTWAGLESTAFLNESGEMAVVVLNRTSEPVAFVLKYGDAEAELSAPPRSIQTCVWDAEYED